MNLSRQHLRPELAVLLAWTAAILLCPGSALARHLEFVEQQVDADLALARSLTISHDGRYLYVGGYRTAVLERDSATGELTFVDAADGARSMVISPDGRNLYVRQYGRLRVLSRHPELGTTTFLESWSSGMDDIQHLSPVALAVSPNGRQVYAVTSSATLIVFARDLATGVLSHLATHYDGFDGVSGLYGARHLAVSPDGAHLYVASSSLQAGRPALAVFGRDASTGGLSFVEAIGSEDVGALDNARYVRVSPDSRHLYVATYGGVLAFARDSSTGALSYLGLHDGRADSIATSPDGRHLYAVTEWQAAVTVLARDTGAGTLSFVEAFALAGLRGADDVLVTPDGRHLYVASYDDSSLAAFTRDAGSGTLSPVATYGRDVEGDADGLEDAEAVVVSPDGRHLYVAGRRDSVAAFSRSTTTGELEHVAVYDESDGFDGLDNAEAITVSPDGRNVYVASGQPDHALVALARDETTGELDFLEAHFDGAGGIDGLEYASSVKVSPDGRNLYVASVGDDAVTAFARDPASGELTFVEAYVDGAGGIDGLTAASSLAISEDGDYVYTGSFGEGAVAVFARNSATGELTFVEAHFNSVTGVSGISFPSEVTLSPDGRNLYVDSGNAVVAFQRHPTSGRLTFLETHFEGTTSSHSLAVSSDGEYLYVFGSEVAVFSRQPADGSLQLLETETFPRFPGYWGPNGTLSPDGRHLYVAATFGNIDGVVALRRSDGPCRATTQSPCLNGNRFRVEVDWRDYAGNTGTATAVPGGTDESGLLWFFDAKNWELQLKVIDACSYNDRFWVFAAATTDVEYTLRVTDELAGVTRTYSNPLGNAAPAITDIDAFATCEAGSSQAARSLRVLPAAAIDPAAVLGWPDTGAGLDLLALEDAPDSKAGLLPEKEVTFSRLLVGLGDKCLDVENGGTAAGTPVNLFECHREANQRWGLEGFCDYGGCADHVEIRGLGDNCLQPAEETSSGRTPLVMGPCGGQEDLWIYSGVYPERLRLMHESSGKCADVEGGSTANGTPVVLYECHDGANQLWDFYQIRCLASPIHRCLNQGRFQVEIEWADFSGNSGLGRAVPDGSSDSGLFWFFDPGNWEMLVKVLDGCGLNEHYWVFAGATTNVEYTLRVTDTETGQVREYYNPPGRSAAAINDTSAFASCF